MRGHEPMPEREALRARNGRAPEPEPLRRVLLGEMLAGGIEPTPQLYEGVLYEGRLHSLASPPGSGKTRTALYISLETLRAGKRVAYIDAENGPKVTAERLGEIGAEPEELDQDLYYYQDEISLDGASLDAFFATMEEVGLDLIVFDSFADMLAAAGLDENSNTDCTRWMGKVAQPLKDMGIAVLVLDHVPKAANSKSPRGASSKVAKVDVQWFLDVTLPYDRGRTGEITLKLQKDREGWLPRIARFSVGGGVFARSVGTIETKEGDGLTGTQRTALEALRPHRGGLTYSEWRGACEGEMSKTAFDNARRHLSDTRRVEQRGQRWHATSSTPPSTPAPRGGGEVSTLRQVHPDAGGAQETLQEWGTPGRGVQDVYPGEQAKTASTPPPHTLKGCVGVPMASALDEDQASSGPEEDDYDEMVRRRSLDLEGDGL